MTKQLELKRISDEDATMTKLVCKLIDRLKEANFHINPITSSFLWLEQIIDDIETPQLQADQQVLDNVKQAFVNEKAEFGLNVHEAAVAQMKSECHQRVQAMFDEIGIEMPDEHYNNEAFEHEEERCLLCWWQALKKKWGVK